MFFHKCLGASPELQENLVNKVLAFSPKIKNAQIFSSKNENILHFDDHTTLLVFQIVRFLYLTNLEKY